MRAPASVLAGALAAAGAWLALVALGYFAGGSECDRAECNALGEWLASDSAAPMVLLVAMALAIGVWIGRLVWTRF